MSTSAEPDADSRYEILELLGEGGMGEVYRARDRVLDRDVAIKRLKPWVLDERSKTRLAREAQTLAQLSHPNVVQIYERLGDDEGFALVMELVHGLTLGQWMAAGPRSWREVLDVFIQAARGLAVGPAGGGGPPALKPAHEAGVVHRDFKPANVMIGDDGRVRVMDFGVAKPPGCSVGDDASEPKPLTPPSVSGGDWDEVLTETGMVVGTPAYMAPEQFQDLPADGRADQYALCVALWQALCGQRPYRGNSYVELGRAKMQAPPQWPRKVDAPRRLVQAIRRGLSPGAEDRWPSMRPLIAEFEVMARRRRSRWLMAGGAIAVMTTAVVLGLPGAEGPASRCDDGLLHEGLWSDERRSEVEAAVLATGASYAASTWQTLVPTLDDYATEWSEERAQLCEVEAAEDPRFDARVRCLRARRDGFEAVIQTLAEADLDGLAAASQAATRLPSLSSCRDAARLSSEPEPDAAVGEQVAAQRYEMARVNSLVDVGRCDDALAILEGIRDGVEATGFGPVRGEFRVSLGSVHSCSGDLARSQQFYEEAYFLATEQGLGSVATRAAIQLIEVVGIEQERHEEGEMWAEHARAELARYPDDSDQAGYHSMMGDLSHVSGRYEDAIKAYETALSVLEQAGVDERRIRTVEGKMSDSLRVLGRNDEALALLERIIEFGERTLGPEHPSVSNHLVSLATLYNQMGNSVAAEPKLRIALEQLERIHGTEHPSVLRAVGNLAMTVSILGRAEDAIPLHQRAIAGMEARYGKDHANVAVALNNLGIDQLATNDVKGASASHRRALEIREQSLGMDHLLTASSLANLAEVHLMMGDIERAQEGFSRALPLVEKALGPEAFPVSYPLTGLGETFNEQGRFAEALPLLERAMAIRDAVPCPPPELMHTRFELARALYATDTDRERAVKLARAAQEVIKGLEGDVSRGEKLRAWLREHDG